MISESARLLLRLHERVPAFTLANVVETLALREGFKPCVRLLLDVKEEAETLATLQSTGLVVVASPTKLRLRERTALGDAYLEPAADDDPTARVELMVARERQTAAVAAEAQSEHGSTNLGTLLGYPPCCVAAQDQQSSVPDWVSDLLSATPPSATYPFGANRFAYLFGEEALGFDYYPCSLNCSGSVAIALATRRVLLQHGLTELAERAEAAMRSPLLVLRGVLVRPKRFWLAADGGTACDFAGAQLRGWKVDMGADLDPVWTCSGVERAPEGRGLRFIRGGVPVLEVPEGQLDNRMLLFS